MPRIPEDLQEMELRTQASIGYEMTGSGDPVSVTADPWRGAR
jgi:hypothetical protein